MTPAADELHAVLEHAFDGRTIERIDRRVSAYRTSFPLEQLELVFADGERKRVIFKDLSRGSLPEGIRRAKPSFVHDPLREIDAYRLVEGANLGAPRCLASVVDPGAGRYWLFLEKISGVELYQVGELETWQEAARWLARLHSRFVSGQRPRARSLLRYDREFLRVWPERAAERLDGELERIAGRYDAVLDRLLALPPTFVHGEFYASNVLVSRTRTGLRVAPVDWEMAGVGPGLIDLAALSTGAWGDEERRALGQAYSDQLAETEAPDLAGDDLERTLEACRLHLALQWLGWSSEWLPPPEHAHDWRAEAVRAAARLDL